jgi:membrane-associated phospholipid phosphatase
VHYPLDIVGGAAVGCLAAVAAHGLVDRMVGIARSRAIRKNA